MIQLEIKPLFEVHCSSFFRPSTHAHREHLPAVQRAKVSRHVEAGMNTLLPFPWEPAERAPLGQESHCYGARQIVGELAGQRWYSESFGLLISSGHRYSVLRVSGGSALCSALALLLFALWLCSSGFPLSVYAARFCILWRGQPHVRKNRTSLGVTYLIKTKNHERNGRH